MVLLSSCGKFSAPLSFPRSDCSQIIVLKTMKIFGSFQKVMLFSQIFNSELYTSVLTLQSFFRSLSISIIVTIQGIFILKTAYTKARAVFREFFGH